MKKVLTSLLAAFVVLHASVALCLCHHDNLNQKSEHCHSEASAPSASQATSHHHHDDADGTKNPSQSHDNCSCIQQDESAVLSKVEAVSIDFYKHLAITHSSFSYFLPDLTIAIPLNSFHDLSPPESSRLYLQKSTFLI